MNPRQYEEMVAEYFRRKGYSVELTSYTNDYGVDCFAFRDGERIAIQAKMYGQGMRSVNRKMMMELRGAMHFFDCNGAALVTNGAVHSDAWAVAAKLGIEVIELQALTGSFLRDTEDDRSFENIWTRYVMPLAGKTLTRSNGKSNTILEVDWSGVKRITSSGRIQKIPIEIFRFAANRLREHGSVKKTLINDEFPGRASAGICLILCQVPSIEYDEASSSLVWRSS